MLTSFLVWREARHLEGIAVPLLPTLFFSLKLSGFAFQGPCRTAIVTLQHITRLGWGVTLESYSTKTFAVDIRAACRHAYTDFDVATHCSRFTDATTTSQSHAHAFRPPLPPRLSSSTASCSFAAPRVRMGAFGEPHPYDVARTPASGRGRERKLWAAAAGVGAGARARGGGLEVICQGFGHSRCTWMVNVSGECSCVVAGFGRGEVVVQRLSWDPMGGESC